MAAKLQLLERIRLLQAEQETPKPEPRAVPEATGIVPFTDWLPQVSPGMAWDIPHLRLIQDALQRITDGSCKRLALFCPPRHGKSEQTTIRYPVWRLERLPATRVCVGCYNQTFAERFGRRARRIAEARGLVSRDRSAAKEWETAGGGVYRSCGVGSPPTGEGFDLIVIDDPIKSRAEAESKSYRDRAKEWYGDLYTRREPGCAIILILTRWHEDDLAGWLLGEAKTGGDKWEVVRLPALAEEDDPLGRVEGEPLWPSRWSAAELLQTKRVKGSYNFASEYQQRPLPAEGGLLRREWFGSLKHRPEGYRWVRFWDSAAKAGQQNDRWAGALVGRNPEGRWCIASVVKGRWEYPEAKKVVLQTAGGDPTNEVGIEDTSSGIPLLQDLRRTPEAARYAFRAVKVTTDKAVRAAPWAAAAEAGLVDLVEGEWVGEFLDEVCVFPFGEHDDQVDAVSGAWGMMANEPEIWAY